MIILSFWDKILGLFGTSEQKLRWKRHLREQARAAERDARTNRVKHVTYRHKNCDACGKLLDRDATVCPYCDARVSSYGVTVAGRVVDRLLPGSGSMTVGVMIACGLVFLYGVLTTGDVWSPSGKASILFGANWGPLMAGGGEWWRLFSYNFLHGGALHIGFNLYALMIVGPLVERWYGVSRATIIYIASGVVGGIASHLVSPMAISVGASGAVLGLIGAGVAAGHLSGTGQGQELRRQLMRWFVFILLFGFIVPGIDNAAHIGGFVAGVGLGAGLSFNRMVTARERTAFGAIALGLSVTCIYALVMALITSWGLPTEDDPSDIRAIWLACQDEAEALVPTLYGDAADSVLGAQMWTGNFYELFGPERLAQAPGELLEPAARACERSARASLFGFSRSPEVQAIAANSTILSAGLYRVLDDASRAARLDGAFMALWSTEAHIVAWPAADQGWTVYPSLLPTPVMLEETNPPDPAQLDKD